MAPSRCADALSASTRPPPSTTTASNTPPTTVRDASSARNNLMRILDAEIASGLYTASVDGSRRIERGVEAIERTASDETRPAFPRDLRAIDGVWRLRYTNNAPRPLTDFSFFGGLEDLFGRDLGAEQAVFQTIDIYNRRLVNTVCVGPWRADSKSLLTRFVPFVGDLIASSKLRLDLDHSFAVDGEDVERLAAGTNRLVVTLEEVRRQLDGDFDDVPEPLRGVFFEPRGRASVPDLVRRATRLVPTALNAGAFDTTYCDATLRVARGLVGRELRVFERVSAVTFSGDHALDSDAMSNNKPPSSASSARRQTRTPSRVDRFAVPPTLDVDDDPDDYVPSD